MRDDSAHRFWDADMGIETLFDWASAAVADTVHGLPEFEKYLRMYDLQ